MSVSGPTVPQGALVLERNKPVNRRVARVLGCAGFEARAVEEPERLGDAALEGVGLVVADAFDADLVARLMSGAKQLRAILYSGEPLDSQAARLLKRALEEPRLVALMGRPSFEAPPREDDLLHIARRCAGAEPAPFEAHLAWGAQLLGWSLTEVAHRDAAVAEVMAFAQRLGTPKRVAEMLGELTHELTMNALYDAPVDERGQPRFAHDRKAEVRLAPGDAAVLRVGCDGVRLALEVADRFGRLQRQHVFGGIARALDSGQMDTVGGGAGLGMMVAYRSTTALFYDVAPGRRTRVTALYDLDLNQREFRQLPKTIHFAEAVA